jgi:hypothetical protein
MKSEGGIMKYGNLRRWVGRGLRRFILHPSSFIFFLLPCLSTFAQNFVKNPDFEQPLGPDNWSVVYVYGGPPDFAVQDRSTIAHKDKVPGTWDGDPNYLDVYGAEFAPYHDARMHAYFKQTVSSLQPLATYVISCWMVHFTKISSNRVSLYLEALGGAAGNVSRTVYCGDEWCDDNPSAWKMYAVTNTASLAGQIEVRLHFDKYTFSSLQWDYMRGYFDHVAVMVPGQSPPPFKVLSVALPNQTTAAVKWETVPNNTYRLDGSSDLASWSTLRDEMLATGTSLTTNVPMGSSVQNFYRILSKNYQP